MKSNSFPKMLQSKALATIPTVNPAEPDGTYIIYYNNSELNFDIFVQIILYLSSFKLATVVEGDPKAHFTIATTPRCRRGRYSIPWIAPLYS